MAENFGECLSVVENSKSKQSIKEEKITPQFSSSNVKTKNSRNIVANTLLRRRYELKYCISEAKAQEVKQFIKHYLQPDPYCKNRPNSAYPLVSLYLDSDNLRLCRESLAGKKNRFKLRIRSYTDDLEYPRFLEIKRRLNNIIVKSQTPIMHCNMMPLFLKSHLPPRSSGMDEEAFEQFLLYMKIINAKPVVRIRYLREAWENDTKQRVRITFDRQICYNIDTSINVLLKGGGWQYNDISLNRVILEIKFTEYYPEWIKRVVAYCNLQQESISKYATSIQQACFLGFRAPQMLR